MGSSILDDTIYSRRLLVRALSLAAMGVACHLVAWTVGFHLLPAGILKGVFLSSRLPVVGGTEGGTLLRILVANVVLGIGLVTVANFFRVGGFPLGYFPVLFHWTVFGVFQGTGSFTVAASPQPPSLRGLVTSRGSWEILAYTVVAVATVGLFLWRQRSWTDWETRRERTFTDIRVSGSEWVAIALALALLLAANWTEAVSLMGR